MKKRRRAFMTAASYDVVAGVILEIEDPDLRKRMADHFATAFHRRSRSFDAYQWEKRTGGKVNMSGDRS